jgi:hypothetical protein
MSLDLHVFSVQSVDARRLSEMCESIEGLRLVGDRRSVPASMTLERLVRGRYDYVASLDGPLGVELEDLPPAVRERALGTTVTYQLTVEGSSAVSFKLAQRVARALAEASVGVVYDPQDDAVTWPKGGTRIFTPPAAKVIDVVRYSWYVRREDMVDSIARDVFDTLAARAPEALPRRFGGYEPLQFKLDVVGPDGFVDQWNAESTGLFWKTNRPFVGGHTFGLAGELGRPPLPHPVGDVSLSIDARAFDDHAWQKTLIDLFVAVTTVSRSFCAIADVDRNIGYSGGNLTHGPEAETTWGSVVRGEWFGLPPDQPWLLWVGPLYAPLFDLQGASFDPCGDGWLMRRGELPLDLARASTRSLMRRLRRSGDGYAVAQDLRMVATGMPGRGGERIRATRVPDGL